MDHTRKSKRAAIRAAFVLFALGLVLTGWAAFSRTEAVSSEAVSDGLAHPQGVHEPVEDGFWHMLSEFDAEAFVGRFGYVAAFVAMYLLGLGLTVTPCVYPVVPITVGYFGAQSEGRWTRQLGLAVVFGTGVAVSYAAAGTAAALSGSLFGAALQNTGVLVALAALCVAMGLNAFGVYELRLPGWFTGIAGNASRGGVVGAALMGLTMGVAAASCLAAFIVSLLAFVGQKGNLALGFSMFLMLGLGFATPFVVLATFSSLLTRIPKSGAWMVYAKKIMGTLLFAAALYFLRTPLPQAVFRPLVLLSLVAAGLYFGFLEKTPVATKKFRAVRLALGAFFLGAALWWSVPGTAASSEGIDWQPYSESALDDATGSGRPVLIYFFAEWCVGCQQLDRVTFNDPRVVQASAEFVALKADLTRAKTAEAFELKLRYGIWGFPTIVFLEPDGRERQELRVVQFLPPDELLERFDKFKRRPDIVGSGLEAKNARGALPRASLFPLRFSSFLSPRT